MPLERILLGLVLIGSVAAYERPLPPEHDLHRQARLEFMLSPPRFLPLTHRETFPGQRPGDPQHLFQFLRDGGGDHAFQWIPGGPLGFHPRGRGTWVYLVDGTTGALKRLTIYLSDSSFTYLSLERDNRLFRAEVFLEGERVASRIPILLNASDLFTVSLRDLVSRTERHIPWDVLLPDDGGMGEPSRRLAQEAARILNPSFPEMEDGALDERGIWRRIATGERTAPGFNCSGLAKWFADALAWGWARRYLPLNETLLEKPLEIRGSPYTLSLEDARDPYFGLDWTRALVRELIRLSRNGPEPSWTEADVTTYPWTRYVPNRGYPLEKLHAVAQWLAVTRPGRLFFLSINGDFRPNEREPILLQHRHVAILAVWTEQGAVHHALFETDGSGARPTSISWLQRRFPNHYVHIVEAAIPRNFRFPDLDRYRERP